MLKSYFTIFCMILFFAAVSDAAQKPDSKKMKKADPNGTEVVQSSTSKIQPLRKTQASLLLTNTNYDYAGNNSIPNSLVMYDITGDGVKDVVAVAMQRPTDANSRHGRMILGNDTDGYTDFAVTQENAGAGWPELRIAEEGPLAGTALVMYHQGGNSWLTKVDLTSFTPTLAPASSFPSNFPSFVYKADGTIYATNAAGELFKSTDQGASFTSTGVFLDPDESTAWNSEYLLKKSPNDQYILHPSAWGFAGEGGPGGTPDDSVDFTGINYSTDGGATWLFEKTGMEGVTSVANRDGYLPLFENFGQINGAVDNNGVMHVTINGYGYWTRSTDTTFAFPALYWNSRDKEWLAITSESMEGLEFLLDPARVTDYPGNGIGNAYPYPVISPDGNTIVVLWQGPEYSGEIGASEVNVTTVTAENPVEIYYTDIYYVLSNDGGKTWTAPAKVEGASEQHVQESYPIGAEFLEVDGSTGVVNFLFFIDEIPGTSLFADNNSASYNNSWNYESFTVNVTTDVNDNVASVNDFKLSQNYPNPFNPSTKIEYSIAERSNVVIKVFDMLGREVSTLVNSSKEAGSYEVNFDASNLSSGLYVYTINAGTFTSSKKMVLMK